jgi:hypothetical protein
MFRRHVTRALLFTMALSLAALPAAAADCGPPPGGWEQLLERLVAWLGGDRLSVIFDKDGPYIDPNGQPTAGAAPGGSGNSPGSLEPNAPPQ